MKEIPHPEDSGSSGTQEAADSKSALIPATRPLEGLPIADTVSGLAATNSRSLGGEVAANLLAGSVTQIASELQETKAQLREVREELKESQAELHKWKEKAAVLEERVDANKTIRNLGNLSIALGTALVGVAIELFRNNQANPSYVCGTIGAAFILLGWFSGAGVKRK